MSYQFADECQPGQPKLCKTHPHDGEQMPPCESCCYTDNGGFCDCVCHSTLAEQLDAAQTGDGAVLNNLFTQPDDIHDAAWEGDE